MTTRISTVLFIFLISVSAAAHDHRSHSMTAAADIKWAAGPGSLPAGAEFSVLKGDPTAEGVFTMRLRMPPGYTIQPHWHPAVEHITVIEGSFWMGLGETLNRAAMHEMRAGAFATMDPGTRHFAAAGDQGAIIQLHGVGPWQVNYVNPAHDPRRTAAKE